LHTVKNEEVTQLWAVFTPHDREGIGLIRREDFFVKIVEEPRTFFGDSIFDFIDCDAQDVVTFGEFVETICLFSLFERNDVLRCKFCSCSSLSSIFLDCWTVLFYLFDKKKTGYVDRDELKHFIVALHGGEVKSNAQLGLSRIEEKPRHDFKDIRVLHRDFPYLLYPVFRLQISMMRVSFGETWWENKKILLTEEMRIKRKNEQSQFTGQDVKKGTVDEEAEKFEGRVREHMGNSKYYLQFWKRDAVRLRLKKMDLIENELNLKLKQQQQDEEDEADL
jgi:Ca2+-binding EF-hand superfamily protein